MMYKSLLSAALLSSVASAQSLADTLMMNNQTSALAAALNQDPTFVQSLSNVSGNITLLAPSNNALSAFLNSSTGMQVAGTPEALRALLSYHILNGTYPSSNLTNMTSFIRTALTNTSYANVTGGQRVEGLALGGNVTIYSGYDNNSTVITPNISFSGGYVHVIDRVLTLPPSLTDGLIAANLTSLYGAAGSAGLAATANGLMDVTVFAPNNAAFAAAVGNATLNQTLLQSILSYHIVANAGRPYYSTRLTNGTSLQTLNGANVTITTTSNGTFVNNAKVVRANILVAGGVIHIIDNVLNPGNSTVTPSANATSGANAFSGVASGSATPFTNNVPSATTMLAGGPASASASSSTAGAAAARPMITGAIGAAALYGAGAWALNL